MRLRPIGGRQLPAPTPSLGPAAPGGGGGAVAPPPRVGLGTLLWWYRAGRRDAVRDESDRLLPRSCSTARVFGPSRPHPPGHARFAGVIRSLEVDGAVALVEIQAGPFVVRAAVSRDQVRELGLTEGSPATATVRAASVMLNPGIGADT